ncbi:SRPBCC family protein [Streptomyces sp. NPDC047002]|uniref:SRPBCC family protein n=1 Tax=Streptomyces sp. NPDC047002 TaxID=3155475 RepID=UPI0034525AA5
MPRTFTVSDSVVVARPPLPVYEEVSNVWQMHRWSPENLGARVRGGQRPAEVGMVFDGRNRRGRSSWTTRCTVLAADPGERFAFRVGAIGLRTPRLRGPIATWEYRFEAVPGGTRVTETWTDDRRRWPDPAARAFDRIATGGTFADFQRRNIATTLRNLKAALEAV